MIGRSFYCGDNQTDAAYAIGTDILLSLADLDLQVHMLKAGTWSMAPKVGWSRSIHQWLNG